MEAACGLVHYLSKQDILRDLGSAIPDAQGWGMGIPQVDPVASPTMTDVGAAQHSPTETPWVDYTIPPLPRHQSAKIEEKGTPPVDSTTSPAMANAVDTHPSTMEALPMDKNTVPLAEFNAEAKQDLPTTWATSPAKSGNQVALTTGLADESGHQTKEKQGVLALTATMEILSLEAPQ